MSVVYSESKPETPQEAILRVLKVAMNSRTTNGEPGFKRLTINGRSMDFYIVKEMEPAHAEANYSAEGYIAINENGELYALRLTCTLSESGGISPKIEAVQIVPEAAGLTQTNIDDAIRQVINVKGVNE